VISTRRAAGLAALTSSLAVLVAPAVAPATTGVGVTRKFTVTVTDRGVSWKPPLRTLHAIVGAKLNITVANGSSASHWFGVGRERTKVLAPEANGKLLFQFTKLGPVTWHAGQGKVTAAPFHGTIRVRLPGNFG
jgi:hypothetical protein